MTLLDLIDLMTAGNTYLNVHSVANPPGEVRGQLTVDDPTESAQQ